jgi:NAD(P)-dependent dehydrogenase (short-subunit alcohol dehydrogenase family)
MGEGKEVGMSGRKIEGSVALVTGANRGIGRALTEALVKRGAKRVYATAREPQALEELARRHPGRVVPLRLDVTDGDEVAQAARAAGDVDVLFNNAGVVEGKGLADQDLVDKARREMEVNYFAPLRLLLSFADGLAARGGALINVSSVAGLTNFAFFPTYSASKAAVHSLTQGARALLASRGVSVIGVYPGPVDTEMAREITLEKASPEHVAEAILDGVEAGTEDVFPDPFAATFGAQFESSPKASERQAAAMVAAG